MSLAGSSRVQNEVPDTRHCATFRPSIWQDLFLQFDSEFLEVSDTMKQQVQMQKEEVKKIFQSSRNNFPQTLNFIDSLQRLGISYHFECEIDDALEQIFHNTLPNNIITIEGDLHYLALLFRLLRQNGFRISSDIFKKFKNDKGNFNEKLAEDIEGMWNLYEASQLTVSGEDILEEALDFSYNHLKSLTNDQLSPTLAKISHCLRKPFRRGVPRIEARRYISIYEQDPSHNKSLLTFAKLDFNMLQNMHQKEIASITKWWKKSDFATQVPYARDRVVEIYFWALAISFEPDYSTTRRTLGKVITCISLLDDTYDNFGTIEELELFTQATQRWDISAIHSLPDCMKVVFNTILGLWNEIELVIEDGKSSMVLQYVKQAFCNLARAYFVEAKWCNEGYIPTYDEYKENGVSTSTGPLQITSFIGLTKFSAQEVFDWVFSNPPIIKAFSLTSRLVDDIASHKFEQQRVHVASAVECCMKQYGISQEDAYEIIQKDVKDCWMAITEECIKSKNKIPKPVLDYSLNAARISEFIYENFEDKYTNPELLKDYVVALLLDPISIE